MENEKCPPASRKKAWLWQLIAVLLIVCVGTTLVWMHSSNNSSDAENLQQLSDASTAIAFGRPEKLKQLVDEGLDLDYVMFDGTTLLHAAAGMGKTRCVQVLLAAGARMDIVDEKGRTPLDMAVQYRKQEVVTLLKKHGAPAIFSLDSNAPFSPSPRSSDAAPKTLVPQE